MGDGEQGGDGGREAMAERREDAACEMKRIKGLHTSRSARKTRGGTKNERLKMRSGRRRGRRREVALASRDSPATKKNWKKVAEMSAEGNLPLFSIPFSL